MKSYMKTPYRKPSYSLKNKKNKYWLNTYPYMGYNLSLYIFLYANIPWMKKDESFMGK